MALVLFVHHHLTVPGPTLEEGPDDPTAGSLIHSALLRPALYRVGA